MSLKIKTWTTGLLLLFAGVILGGWVPRAELRSAHAEIAALKKARPSPAIAPLSQVQALLRVDGVEAPARRPRQSPPKIERNELPASEPVEPEESPTPPASPTDSPTDIPMEESPPSSFRERLETASEVWRLRADLARQQLFDRVKPEPEQAARFDVLMEVMNLRLGSSIDDWAARIAEADAVSPAMGVRMMHEITGVLALTYDELDRTLPPDWQANDDDGRFELVTFIDPSVAMPLIEVEDALRDSRSARRRRFDPQARP